MSWDDAASSWDERPAVRLYARLAFANLEQQLLQRGLGLKGARVLDFGCGTGLLTERMAPLARQVVALDRSDKMLQVLAAKGLPDVDVVGGELSEVIQSHASLQSPFQLITCSSVCSFLTDYPRAVAQLAGLLAPGGLFVQWDWELDPSEEEPFGLSRQAIAEALGAAGLQQVSVGVAFERLSDEFPGAPLLGVGVKA